MKTYLKSFQFDRVQRILLFGGTNVWFLAIVTSQQRNYVDSWILEDIFWPFIGFVVVLLFVLAQEEDNRIVALLSAWAIITFSLIPALKYKQPYGTTIDSTIHIQMVQSLVQTGRVASSHTYAKIPAMHAWLATLGLTAGKSAEWSIKFGLPLTGGLMPLLIYWVGKRLELPSKLGKYMIIASCLSSYTYFSPNGTGFTLVPLFALLYILVLREYDPTLQHKRKTFTIIAIIGLFQLLFWHSTTPFLLPFMLIATAFSPTVIDLIYGRFKAVKLNTSFLIFGFMAGIIYFTYHFIEADQVFSQLFSMITDILKADEDIKPSVPQRIFEISQLDLLKVTLLAYGQELLLYGMMALGILVIWFQRHRWKAFAQLFTIFFLLSILFGGLLVAAVVSGVSYQRFLLVPLAASPLFVGAFFWWLVHKLQPYFDKRWPRQVILLFVIFSAFGLWVIDFFPYQPLVPKINTKSEQAAEDYLVWFHSPNSAYQLRMLSFAENYTDPKSRFAIDIIGQREFLRYFGNQVGIQRGLYLPLHRQEPIDPEKVDFFLLHWPGPAGAFGEKIEYRSVSAIAKIRDEFGRDLIYDNGESFILAIDPVKQDFRVR